MTQKKQYHKSGKQIIEEKKKQKRMKQILESINNDKEGDIPNLVGRQVILNQELYEKSFKGYRFQPKFIEWYNENKDEEFTVKCNMGDFKSVYELEGVETWVFNYFDLLNPKTGKHYIK